ncbi:MAG: selenocysteine-specific translation elongation factor [Oscillospiraceae bacterium]
MNAVYITAGHIDHGKTALVRALTGISPDCTPEEKRRGITIEPGFVPFCEGDICGTIIDVPGHEKLLRNMAAAASVVHVAIFAVDANEGAMPQTMEHLAVLGILGCKRGVIALTKCDRIGDDALCAAVENAKAFAKGSFLENAAIIKTSAVTGEGIAELKAELLRLGSFAVPREVSAPFFMAVDRAFTKTGFGAVVTGTALCGSIKSGDGLTLYPSDTQFTLRGIASGGKNISSGTGGMRLAINLAKIKAADIHKGDVICAAEHLPFTNAISAKVSFLQGKSPVESGTELQLCIGAKAVLCRITLIGETAFIRAKTPLCTRAGQRFLLRSLSPAATIGGGEVLCPFCENTSRADTREKARIAAYNHSLNESVIFEISRGGKSMSALKSLFFSYPVQRLQNVIDALEDSRKIRLVKGEYVLYEREFQSVKATSEQRVFEIYKAAAFTPPNFEDLPGLACLSKEICVHCLTALCKSGDLLQLTDAIYMDKIAFDAIVATAVDIIKEQGGVTVATLRDALCLSRKYSRAVLEYCDRANIFINKNDLRILP